LICVEAGVCKTVKIEQKGVKYVDASGMPVRVHAEKAVTAEEEQRWQVLMESVGRKSGRLERTFCLEVEKTHHRGEPAERKRREKTDMRG